MGEEDAAAQPARPAGVLGVNGRREGIDGKSVGVCIAIAKQEEAVAGFADDFRMSGDVVANLL